MNFLKRSALALALSISSLGVVVFVAPATIYAHADAKQDLINLIDQRIAPLIEEKFIWLTAANDPNVTPQAFNFYVAQEQALTTRINSLLSVKAFLLNNTNIPASVIEDVTLVLESVVSPDVPSVL
jgi:hypothetical protein